MNDNGAVSAYLRCGYARSMYTTTTLERPFTRWLLQFIVQRQLPPLDDVVPAADRRK